MVVEFQLFGFLLHHGAVLVSAAAVAFIIRQAWRQRSVMDENPYRAPITKRFEPI